MSPHLILGIDPGLSGALALYDPGLKQVVGVWDMPLREKQKKGFELDLVKLALLIAEWAGGILFSVVEDVSAMTYVDAKGATRGQGAAASFNFGKATGAVHGILASCMIPTVFVKPSIWKMLTGLSSDKNKSREKAIALFPSHTHTFARKKDDGRAEALLLAVFGADRFLKRGAS